MTAITYDEFMAEAEKSAPLLFEAVAALYPVFSHSKIRHVAERENHYNENLGYEGIGGYHCSKCRLKARVAKAQFRG